MDESSAVMDVDAAADQNHNVAPSKAEPDDTGDSLHTIYRGLCPWSLQHFPDIEASAEHAVLFNLPIEPESARPPRPWRAPPKWDVNHVRLPNSTRSQYPITNANGDESICNRWELILDSLDTHIRTSHDLERAIGAYNSKYSETWRFVALHRLCEDFSAEARANFFDHTLPAIIALATRLPELIEAPIPLLRTRSNSAISFTQHQIACLLANAFLCTFPRRNSPKRCSEYRQFPEINFNRLFQQSDETAQEKLKCLLHYFARVSAETPKGVVTVLRRHGRPPGADWWSRCEARFGEQRLHVNDAGTIEDQGCGLLQVDFANKYLGGGVLGRGCVQEEIRFVICPELLITKLVAEILDPADALFVCGAERMCEYTGYASTFRFAGEHRDRTPRDAWRRRMCAIVAIDAQLFGTSSTASEQFSAVAMRRELDKAWAGFRPWLRTPAAGVATGNWGCGAFGGDKRLKALLQLMAAAATGQPLVYFTFGDAELQRDLLGVWRWLRSESISVAKVWSYLLRFRDNGLDGRQLYAFLRQIHEDERMKNETTPGKGGSTPVIQPLIADNATAKRVEIPEKVKHFEPVVKEENDVDVQPESEPVATATQNKKPSLLDALDRHYYGKSEPAKSPERKSLAKVENETPKTPKTVAVKSEQVEVKIECSQRPQTPGQGSHKRQSSIFDYMQKSTKPPHDVTPTTTNVEQ